MKKLILILLPLVLLSSTLFFKKSVRVEATSCKHENAECSINESGSNCCTGLVCVPFNEQSGNYKCQLPTVHDSPTPTQGQDTTLTPSPTSVDQLTSTPPIATETPVLLTSTPVPTEGLTRSFTSDFSKPESPNAVNEVRGEPEKGGIK